MKQILIHIIVLITVFASKVPLAYAEFSVGYVIPLSGPAADFGIAIQNANTLAQQDSSKLFEQIRFLYEDAVYYKQSEGVGAFKKLVQQDKVDLVVTWGVPNCEALAPLAEQLKKPLVGLCLNPYVAKDKRYVLRFLNPIDHLAKAQVEFFEKKNYRRVGVLLAEHHYPEELFAAFERNRQPHQQIKVFGRVAAGESDFRPWIAKIIKEQKDIDVLWAPLAVGQIGSFAKQARQLLPGLAFFGSNTYESLSEVRAADGALDGIPFASARVRPEFATRYAKQFKNESQLSFAAPAYELAQSIGKLFGRELVHGKGKQSTFTPEGIVQQFAHMPPQQGAAMGAYEMRQEAEHGLYANFPVVIKVVRGEEFRVYEE